MNAQKFLPYKSDFVTTDKMLADAAEFYHRMNQRRTVREFSDKPVAKEIIEKIIMTASTAPSGANKQPWTFCLVSNPEIKKQIRIAAEQEEYENYHGRMSEEWRKDLEQFGTDWKKPFLEIAPYLVVVFKRIYEIEEGNKKNNYYVTESVGIACGILLTAIHKTGLVALTHTPSPMNFLASILNRPENERAFLLIPVGYAHEHAKVPDIKRKTKEEVIVSYE